MWVARHPARSSPRSDERAVDRYRATAVQERFWLLDELHRDSPLCNEAIVLRLNGTLDVARLRVALDQLVARHDALRTSFVQHGGVLYAEVAPDTACPFEHIDLAAAGAPVAAAVIDEQIDRAARARFDLTQAPLIRASLLRVGADVHVLVLVAHHTVIDGRSMFHLLPHELAGGLAMAGAVAIGEPSVNGIAPALRGGDSWPAPARGGGDSWPAPALRGGDSSLAPALRGGDSSLAPALRGGAMSVTYADFARHARAAETGDAVEHDLAYFRQLLHGAPPAIELPVDRRHPPRPSMRGVRAEQMLPPALRAQVQELATRLRVRAFDVTCAAFTAQLMRYSGQLDVVLGSPVANRGGDAAFADVVGCCIDTLLLRAQFDAPPAFDALVRAIHEQRRESNRHRSLSFGTLLDSLAGKRDPARNPLYQVMFNYMDFSVADVPFAGLDVQARRRALATSMLDLSLDVTEQAGGYLLALEANADVFDAAHAARMLQHFVALLDHAVRAPATQLGALDMLDAEERRRADVLSRGPVLADPGPELFHVELWRRAASFADAPALRSDLTALTYAELFERAAELARRLLDYGVSPGDFVLVRTLPDPVDTVVAILGVLCAGGAFVPLEASHPLSRQRELASDSGARFLVSDSPNYARELAAGLVHVSIRAPAGHARRAGVGLSALPDVPGLAPGHPAYLLYTSGSTGRPKGVIVRHANLTYQLHARLAAYDDAPGRVLAPYSFAFDSALASLSWTLAVGGELRLLSDAGRHDLARMREVLQRDRVTHFDAVPSLYSALLESAGPHDFPDLRLVICGGEALPAAVVRRHWQTLPHARLFNEYGPTEATVFASVHEIARDAVEAVTPIGRPIAGSECALFDAFGAQVPAGHSGELYIGGPGVAAGYHRRPEESAARFVADPRALQQPAPVLYRTGDRVRYRDDGVLEFLGRVDDQVQVRGHRVELGEIEAALCRASGVADAAAVLREDEHGEARLYAYVVTSGRIAPALRGGTMTSGGIAPALRGGTMSVAAGGSDAASSFPALARALRASLPGYMVPDVLVPLAALPRSGNGKIDRAALPVVGSGVHATAGYVAPRTDLERDLVAIFEDVLAIRPLGARDNFFDRGGHSLLAVRLVDMVYRRIGHRIALADFAFEPTPEAVARRIQGGRATAIVRRCLDVLHDRGEGVPFVFIGSTAQARFLSQKLAPTRPMLAFNLFGLHEPRQELELDIDRVVDHYLRELRSVRPHGPYALGGYCEDAKVAIAMARKLRDGGEQVPLLALIDAVFFVEEQVSSDRDGGPGVTSARPGDLDGVDGQRASASRRRDVGQFLNRIKRISMYGYEDARRLLARGERRFRERLGLKVPLVLEHRMLFANYLEALAAYRSPAIEGGVALYLASEWGLRNEHLSRMQDVAVREIRSYHESLFEGDQLLELAKAVQDDLSAADALVGVGAAEPRKLLRARSDGGSKTDN